MHLTNSGDQPGVLSEEERLAWRTRSPPASARSPLSRSFLASAATDELTYLDRLKMDQLRTEVTLLTNELENINANYVRLEERLRKSRLAAAKAERQTEDATVRTHKERLAALAQEHGQTLQSLHRDRDEAEAAHRDCVAGGAATLYELSLFWDTRKKRLSANFEERGREDLLRLDDEHRRAMDQLESQIDELRRSAADAEEERKQQSDVAQRAQKRLQQIPLQLRRAAEEDHLRTLDAELSSLRKSAKLTAGALTAQVQGEHQEITGLRQLLRDLELNTDAQSLLREAGLATERRKAQLRGEHQQRGEARLHELSSLRAQLRKDVERVAGSTASLQESYAQLHADAAREAEHGHAKRLALLREELGAAREGLQRSDAELLMAEETRHQTQKVLKQRFGDDFTTFVEEEITRTSSPAARDCLELILRLERNDARIACLQEQLGSSPDFSESGLTARIQSLQRELKDAREVLQGEQVRLKAIREALVRSSLHASDPASEAKRDIIDMLAF